MEFWLLSGIITALVGIALALSAISRRTGAEEDSTDVQVYKDQLSEVDRDFARGVISDDEADRLRLEVQRRLLDADRNSLVQTQKNVAKPNPVLATLILVTVFAGAYYLYGQLGSAGYRDLPLEKRLALAEDARLMRASQEEIEAQVPARENANADPAHLELMEKLREALKSRPDDLQGHILLSRNEAGLGNYIAAHKAQGRVLEIKGPDANANDFANYADLLALAANGYISPEAEAAVKRTLSLDPANGSGRYYLGLLQAQIGRPDLAFKVWRKLLSDSNPEAPWVPPIRAQIEFVAANAGIRFELPQVQPGPDAADVAAAQDMNEAERNEMISGMVDQLSERLATQGGSAQEWARLIGALGVLGEKDRAISIWTEAQQVFASAQQDLDIIRAAANSAGITN